MGFYNIKDCPEIRPELDDKGNVVNPSYVDQFDGQDFMLGENGFKRSDVSALMHTENQKLQQAILNRMIEVPSSGVPADTPVSDIIQMIVPKYCNTSASLREWLASLDKGSIADLAAKYAPKEVVEPAKETITFEENKTE